MTVRIPTNKTKPAACFLLTKKKVRKPPNRKYVQHILEAIGLISGYHTQLGALEGPASDMQQSLYLALRCMTIIITTDVMKSRSCNDAYHIIDDISAKFAN
ncbi:hypothetical protein Trydic_g4374 [Trypoxylus dichotomus]